MLLRRPSERRSNRSEHMITSLPVTHSQELHYVILHSAGGGVIVRRRSQKHHFQVETAIKRQVLYHVTLVPVPVLLVVYASS